MSLRSVAVCAVGLCAVISLTGCSKPEAAASNAVQHRSAWQREAGQSPQSAAIVARQSQQNTQALAKAMQAGTPEALSAMQGKLVAMNGELADQADGSWTLKKDGWTIVAQVSDLTPHANLSKAQVSACGAQGVIQKIDLNTKTIALADVELAPEMKSPMAGNVAAK